MISMTPSRGGAACVPGGGRLRSGHGRGRGGRHPGAFLGRRERIT